MTTTTTDHDNRDTRTRSLLTIAEVADRLGVTVRHVRRLVHERRIPYIKWGRLLRFDPDELDAWIVRHRVPPDRQDPRPT